MMAIDNWLEPDKIFASDACLKGCAAWLNKDRHFFHSEFPAFICKNSFT